MRVYNHRSPWHRCRGRLKHRTSPSKEAITYIFTLHFKSSIEFLNLAHDTRCIGGHGIHQRRSGASVCHLYLLHRRSPSSSFGELMTPNRRILTTSSATNMVQSPALVCCSCYSFTLPSPAWNRPSGSQRRFILSTLALMRIHYDSSESGPLINHTATGPFLLHLRSQ